MTDLPIVEALRAIDHGSVEDCFLMSPMYRKAADAIEMLVKALEPLACYEDCWCGKTEHGEKCPNYDALAVLEKVRSMK